MPLEDAHTQPPSPTQRPLGWLLRRHRRYAALSQETLAERAGVSVRAISGIERGEGHIPYAATVRLLADALALTPAERAEFLAAARPPHGSITHLPVGQRRAVRAHTPASDTTPWEPAGFLTPNHPAQPLWRLPDLPVPLAPLIGRTREIAQVCDVLRDPDIRLVTLCGPPGVGKSRLALQVAHTLRDKPEAPEVDRLSSFPDGIVFVDLAALHEAAQVIPAIAQALSVQSASGWTLAERLLATLRQRRLLLLLDTCEHVLEAGADLVALLQACPEVKALATSRAALGVRGEQIAPVQPLALPEISSGAPDEAMLASLATVPAIALFVARAQAITPAFTLTSTTAPAIAEICRRLDGLPLAIELAATRLTVFSPQELLARLEHRLPVLTGAARDLPVRQRTLRNALAWSYDLLTSQEQTAFRRLAVFAGGATRQAAEAIQCFDDATSQPIPADTLATLATLERHSLLAIQMLSPNESGVSPETRIRLLDTIHEYAEERLLASGEVEHARRAHARYFTELAEAAEATMWQDDTSLWERLPAELDNLRAALRWASAGAAHGDSEGLSLGLRLGAALAPLWYHLGQAPEGSRWLAGLLDDAARQPGGETMETTERARALYMTGWLAMDQGELIRAEELLVASVAAYRRLSEQSAYADCGRLAEALDRLASGRWRQGNHTGAEAALSEALGIRRLLGDAPATALALSRVGYLLMSQGRAVEAEAAFQEALALYRAGGVKWGVVYTLAYRGDLARLANQLVRAETLYDEALALARRSKNRRAVAYILGKQGALARTRGAAEQAHGLLRESLLTYHAIGATGEEALMLLTLGDIAYETGDQREGLAHYQHGLTLLHDISAADGVVASLERIASIFVAADQDAVLRAARLLGLCEAMRTQLGFPLAPRDAQRRAAALAQARASLGEQRVALAVETGAALSLEQGVADAQDFTFAHNR